MRNDLLEQARALLADVNATAAEKLVALFAAIFKYGQTIDLSWCRLLHIKTRHPELDDDAFDMLIVEKFDEGLARPATISAGVGVYANHLNAFCEQKARQPETRRAATRALIDALIARAIVTRQVTQQRLFAISS